MRTLLFIDTETSGRNPSFHGLLSLGYIVDQDGQIVLEGEILIRSEEKLVSEEALKINGINLDEHNKMALSRKDAYTTIETLLSGYRGATLIGHKVSFDIGFLVNLLGISTWTEMNLYRQIDTLDVLRFLQDAGVCSAKYSGLESAAKHFGLLAPDESQKHTALADAQLTRALYYAMQDLVAPQVTILPRPGGR